LRAPVPVQPQSDPVPTFSYGITVSATALARKAELLRPLYYPDCLRSFLAPYRGENVSVHLIVDPTGSPHVLLVEARFPLSEFVRARFREAAERTRWRPAADAWDTPLASRVVLLVPIR